MATFNRVHATIELADGRFIRERITLPDQLQYERSVRANGWNKDDQALANAFLGWHAAKRTGQLECSWEEFTTVAVDMDITREEVDTDAAEGDDQPGGFTH